MGFVERERYPVFGLAFVSFGSCILYFAIVEILLAYLSNVNSMAPVTQLPSISHEESETSASRNLDS